MKAAAIVTGVRTEGKNGRHFLRRAVRLTNEVPVAVGEELYSKSQTIAEDTKNRQRVAEALGIGGANWAWSYLLQHMSDLTKEYNKC